MLQLNISKRAGEFLKALPPKQCKQNFTAILELSKNPFPHDAKKLKGIKGMEKFYRIDVGEYRIIYEFDDTTVHIILIGKRNDDEVYNHFIQQR